MIETKFIQHISEQLELSPTQVTKAIELLNSGATIPFIARYRKDVTEGMDEVQLEITAERNTYFTALTDRREYVRGVIEKQGKLSEELRKKLEDCTDKAALEDLYLPFKKRRRTKATVAREKGLLPLAEFLWEQEPKDVTIEEYAATFARPEKAVASAEDALAGARHILAEQVSLDGDVRASLRDRMLKEGKIRVCSTKNAEGRKTKYENYYDSCQPLKAIPSHRFLAISRGVKEGLLRMDLELDDAQVVSEIVHGYVKEWTSPFAHHIGEVVEDAYARLLRPSVENEVLAVLREEADEEAIRVFRENARSLLLAAPAGQLGVIGVDPGLRTGCKLAVVDQHGAYLESATVFPGGGSSEVETAEQVLLALMAKHEVRAVAVGNGTGCREAAAFVRKVFKHVNGEKPFCVFVNEAGASVYSASPLARDEFPDLDVTIRGAISIARRLQDPLAELVKIDPRHIGVGQYQHDVNQRRLREGLHRTVVQCVNQVGVDLNTASVALLKYVSGIQAATAENIVTKRSELNGFTSLEELHEVSGVGPKVFEQSAGFMRIAGGANPLDATSIHPEAYDVVGRIAESAGISVAALVGNPECLSDVDMSQFVEGSIGVLTLKDIREELAKPGRDPRTEFRVPQFMEGVESVGDLQDGMVLEGVVTNVTDFGAFVDVGVHQDGLVHLSELANHFVRDPRSVVKVGQIVRVRVLKVDRDLPRISLSMKALMRSDEQGERRRRRPPQEAVKGGDRPTTKESREERLPARSSGEGREERGRAARSGQGAGRRSKKPVKAKPAHAARGGDSGALLNTQLAEQLAALKEQMGS